MLRGGGAGRAPCAPFGWPIIASAAGDGEGERVSGLGVYDGLGGADAAGETAAFLGVGAWGWLSGGGGVDAAASAACRRSSSSRSRLRSANVLNCGPWYAARCWGAGIASTLGARTGGMGGGCWAWPWDWP
jgi:hypothetical protein